jgi:hypothetical protein
VAISTLAALLAAAASGGRVWLPAVAVQQFWGRRALLLGVLGGCALCASIGELGCAWGATFCVCVIVAVLLEMCPRSMSVWDADVWLVLPLAVRTEPATVVLGAALLRPPRAPRHSHRHSATQSCIVGFKPPPSSARHCSRICVRDAAGGGRTSGRSKFAGGAPARQRPTSLTVAHDVQLTLQGSRCWSACRQRRSRWLPSNLQFACHLLLPGALFWSLCCMAAAEQLLPNVGALQPLTSSDTCDAGHAGMPDAMLQDYGHKSVRRAPMQSDATPLIHSCSPEASVFTGAAPPRPRLIVRLFQWLFQQDMHYSAVARFAALVLLLRLCAEPWSEWRRLARSLARFTRRLFYGVIVFLVIGPTFGAFLVWALVLLPIVMVCVLLVVVSLRLVTIGMPCQVKQPVLQ